MYISRESGDDSWSCDQSKPCRTIWRAVTLASREDRIHLDGTNTDKNPYTCQPVTSNHPGIYINRSLSLIGYASPMPQIRCSEGTGLTFNGSDNAQQMNVTLSGLLVNESFVSVQDSSVNIDGCKFEGSKQGVEFVILNKMASNIQITNSTFSKNRKCISVTVSSTKRSSMNTQVVFKMENSSFDANVLSDDGRCISFTELHFINQSVSCDITLENVTFSRNSFSPKGLVSLEIENGDQNIHLQSVTFIDNSPSSGQDVSTRNGDSECIIDSTTANISINSSNFTSQNARSFNVSASQISLQIYNSSFCGHRVNGNGGIVSLRGTDVCTLNVSNSSFLNTTAAQGGAINLECANVDSATIERSIFTDNSATNGGGGAVYIYSPGSLSKGPEYSTNDKSELDYSGCQSVEQLLQINITGCNFTNAYSSFSGGAVYINAVNSSIRLRHSAFTKCTARGGDILLVNGGGGIFVNSGNDLLLTVESSRFMGCTSGVGGGSLNVVFENQVEINIENSRFSSSYGNNGGAVSILPSNLDMRKANSCNITIAHSTFSNNSVDREQGNGGAILIIVENNQSSVLLQTVTMELNSAGMVGGAASMGASTIKIHHSRFLKNTGWNVLAVGGNVLDVQDSLFESSSSKTATLEINCFTNSTSINIFNTTFNNCSADEYGGAMSLNHVGNMSLAVKRSLFVENRILSEFGYGAGAMYLNLAPDTEKDPGCIKEPFFIDEFPSWVYKSQVLFEDTTFERNAGYAGGAVHLTHGKATFRNCHFIDNFAATQGGHIYTVPGSASLIIHNSVFRQTTNEIELSTIKYPTGSFIQAESSGALRLRNTTMDVKPYSSTGPLMLVKNGRLIDLGNNNLTTFICPVGSQMEILNFSDQFTTQVNNKPCRIKLTTLQFSCSACTGNSYSLQRGRAIGSQLAPGFQCLPCPFGANCSHNILAKPNFWGFKEMADPPTLKFTMCPLGYCSPPQKTDFPEYNGCQGNRSGELCGHCNESYTESLYSTNCRLSHECKDYWFWPVTLAYVSLMALYLTFKPLILPWIKRQILWFKTHEPASEDNNLDKGYLKIIFYFYQAANLLFVSNSAQHIFKTKFIEPLVGLFNFQQKVSSVCPFPGFTVVTKQLFSASHVFGTMLMIGIFYILHWGIQKCRGQGTPSVGPFFGGVLQTLLLGYTTLASVTFNMLRCVPIGSEKRLLYDGNVVCFQWWQYILIAFICTYFVPLVLTLFWGSFKFYNRTISMGKLLLACSFPLPYLLYWTFVSLFSRARNGCTVKEDSPSSQVSRSSVERVLYDSFKRPEDGGKLSLSWESVMIGRRLILIVLKAFVSDPMPRLLIMILFCVLFLLHHALSQPFRDGFANIVETISLLFVVVLAIVNVFFASFLSLAVPLNDHFTSWWNACQVVEIVILCAVPAVFGLLVVAAVLSQVCRLTVVVCRVLFHFIWVRFSWCCSKQADEMRPVLT